MESKQYLAPTKICHSGPTEYGLSSTQQLIPIIILLRH
uniref:Uncharacterized protein n=1 Tax=Arundo donax TaxID=35708 RepID=A0A0A9HJS3_ARUDO